MVEHLGGLAEEFGHSFQRHACAVGLAVGTVAGNVGRGDVGQVEQLAVDVGLVLPSVDHGSTDALLLECGLEGLGVDHFAPAGIDDHGPRLEQAEEVLVGQMVGGVRRGCLGEWCVEGDDVALLGNRFERNEGDMFVVGHEVVGKGVAAENLLAAQATGHVEHFLAHMSAAHHADGEMGKLTQPVGGIFADGALQREELWGFAPSFMPAFVAEQLEQAAEHVLRHALGIAARAVGPSDAGLAEVVGVEVVVADGGGGDEPHARPFEQLSVAAGAGADDQGIGIAHIGGSDGRSGQVDHFAELFGIPLHVGDAVVYDEFHVLWMLVVFAFTELTGWGKGRECSIPCPVPSTVAFLT